MVKSIEDDDEPKITAVKSEELDTSLTRYQPLTPVHFEELNLIWPLDPRIPSPKSRRAWALARGLNPVNVNNWWYRRRKVAKKLKISIPNEKYDLDVGTPPILTAQNLSIKSEDVPASMIPDSSLVISCDAEDDITSFATHIPSSDDFSSISDGCVSTITLVGPNCDETKPDFIVLASEPSALPDSIDTVDVLPLSRQSSVSPFPPLVTLFVSEAAETLHLHDHDTTTSFETPRNIICAERDALWASFYALDSLYPLTLLPTNISGIPVSSCSSKAFWKFSDIQSEDLTKLPLLKDASYIGDVSSLEAPWCINGFRIHFDGSMIGLCSCFYYDASHLSCSMFSV